MQKSIHYVSISVDTAKYRGVSNHEDVQSQYQIEYSNSPFPVHKLIAYVKQLLVKLWLEITLEKLYPTY